MFSNFPVVSTFQCLLVVGPYFPHLLHLLDSHGDNTVRVQNIWECGRTFSFWINLLVLCGDDFLSKVYLPLIQSFIVILKRSMSNLFSISSLQFAYVSNSLVRLIEIASNFCGFYIVGVHAEV